MQSTLVTCHECREQSYYYVVEWPPRYVPCGHCGQFFKFALQSDTGRVFLQMVPYKL